MRSIQPVAFVIAFATVPVHAWEADTTHVGLTEQAALSSFVHGRLGSAFGRAGGWLEPLGFAPERAPELYAKFGLIEPSSGVVPDGRGRQSALAWLLAGTVLEAMPAERGRNHSYDPIDKRGQDEGRAAPDWVLANENDLGLPRFWFELERSVTAAGPAERDEHLAMALIGAGAMLHVLEDLGVPARVRADRYEFLLPLGGGFADRGSRFERLAALLYGRLGVLKPSTPIARERGRDYFAAADGQGLADVTNHNWYSQGSLPAVVRVPAEPRPGEVVERIRQAQRYPFPRPEQELEYAGKVNATLRNGAGTCLANYRLSEGQLRFHISDDCAAEQLAAILPTVGGYAAGYLNWLFRGALAVTVDAGMIQVTVAPGAVALAAGQLTLLGEDAAGHRSVIGTGPFSGSAKMPVTGTFTRIYALFRGTDSHGETLVAVGASR